MANCIMIKMKGMSVVAIAVLTAHGPIAHIRLPGENSLPRDPEYRQGSFFLPTARVPLLPPSGEAVDQFGRMTALVGATVTSGDYVQFVDQQSLPPFKEIAQQEAEIRLHQTSWVVGFSGDCVECCF